MHFVSRKAGNIETFFWDLWDGNIPQIREKSSCYQIWKLLQSQYAFQWMILICESFLVFIHCIRMRNYITPYNIKICDVYGASVPQCVMWNHNKSVKYSSVTGLSRKQGQIISHYFQYSLTRSQKLTTCLTRGNIKANINTANPKNWQETLFESLVSWDTCISTFFYELVDILWFKFLGFLWKTRKTCIKKTWSKMFLGN